MKFGFLEAFDTETEDGVAEIDRFRLLRTPWQDYAKSGKEAQ